MWSYEKRLQYPVDIKKPDARLAKVIMTQFGGPDGELGASQRYLSQRYVMPYPEIAATLTDIGTFVSKAVHLYVGATVFDTVNLHFSGRIFR